MQLVALWFEEMCWLIHPLEL